MPAVAKTLYPFTPRWFPGADGWLHYVDEGQGPPVVMLHGNPDWSFSYRKVIQALSSGYRCLALDQLGFGRSDKPLDASYHPQAQADRLAEWLQALQPEAACLVLNDWGGPIGCALAQRYPAMVQSLVLMNTWLWPLRPYWGFPAFSQLMSGRTGKCLVGYGNLFSKLLVWLAVHHKRVFSGSPHAGYLWPYPRPSDRIAQYTMPYYLMAAEAWFEALYQHASTLAQHQIALVWGLKDPAFRPGFLRRWETLFPAARVTKLAKAGHFPQEEQPAAVAAAVQAVTA